MKAYYFEGENGEKVITKDIPADMMEEAEMAREEMIDAVSLFSDELTDAILGETQITEDMIINAVRTGTISRQMPPVFLGSAIKIKLFSPCLMQWSIIFLHPLTLRTRQLIWTTMKKL